MKKRNVFVSVLLCLPLVVIASSAYQGLSPRGKMVPIANPNVQLLPNPFPVYTDGNVVVNHPYPGFKKINIPVDNRYQKKLGCYILCYAHGQGLYRTANDIYAQGLVRVAGRYNQNRVCIPAGTTGKDISAMQRFKAVCNARIKTCKNGCWAGGDTGGWYGMQQQ